MTQQMSEEARSLVAKNIGLAHAFSIKARGRHPEMADEIESAAMAGLCAAAAMFDPLKGFAFSTFAFACMRNEVSNLIRKEKAARAASLSWEGDGDEARTIEPIDHREPAPAEAVVRAQEIEALRHCLGELPAREQFVIRRWRLEGATLEAVGCELGEREGRDRPISKERVRQLATRALALLGRALRAGASGRPLATPLTPASPIPSPVAPPPTCACDPAREGEAGGEVATAASETEADAPGPIQEVQSPPAEEREVRTIRDRDPREGARPMRVNRLTPYFRRPLQWLPFEPGTTTPRRRKLHCSMTVTIAPERGEPTHYEVIPMKSPIRPRATEGFVLKEVGAYGGDGPHIVTLSPDAPQCTCAGFAARQGAGNTASCQHITALRTFGLA